jgi:hypothetical protein
VVVGPLRPEVERGAPLRSEQIATGPAVVIWCCQPLIRRVCRGFFPPGHMPLGLRGYRSLLCVVTQSYAVLYGQNQTTGRAHGSEGDRSTMPLAGQTTHAASSVVYSQLTILQSMAKVSSTVHGLACSASSPSEYSNVQARWCQLRVPL